MRRIPFLAAALIAAMLAVSGAALADDHGGRSGGDDRGGASSARFDLKGEVYPSFKIELKTAAGRRVSALKPGVYRIKVEDKSSIHNFHLVGPGVNRTTTVGGTAETIWTVRLKAGRYTFMCDPHASQMRGTFRVRA